MNDTYKTAKINFITSKAVVLIMSTARDVCHLTMGLNILLYKSSPGDEIPERDVTYIVLYDYLLTPVLPVRNIFLSKARVLRIMDVGLRKVPCMSTFRISIMNYYLVCSLAIYKYVLC